VLPETEDHPPCGGCQVPPETVRLETLQYKPPLYFFECLLLENRVVGFNNDFSSLDVDLSDEALFLESLAPSSFQAKSFSFFILP